MRPGLWKLPELWTHRAAPTAPWKTTEQVFHSYHRPSSSLCLKRETESANLSTKPGQPQGLAWGLGWGLVVGRTLELGNL